MHDTCDATETQMSVQEGAVRMHSLPTVHASVTAELLLQALSHDQEISESERTQQESPCLRSVRDISLSPLNSRCDVGPPAQSRYDMWSSECSETLCRGCPSTGSSCVPRVVDRSNSGATSSQSSRAAGCIQEDEKSQDPEICVWQSALTACVLQALKPSPDVQPSPILGAFHRFYNVHCIPASEADSLVSSFSAQAALRVAHSVCSYPDSDSFPETLFHSGRDPVRTYPSYLNFEMIVNPDDTLHRVEACSLSENQVLDDLVLHSPPTLSKCHRSATSPHTTLTVDTVSIPDSPLLSASQPPWTRNSLCRTAWRPRGARCTSVRNARTSWRSCDEAHQSMRKSTSGSEEARDVACDIKAVLGLVAEVNNLCYHRFRELGAWARSRLMQMSLGGSQNSERSTPLQCSFCGCDCQRGPSYPSQPSDEVAVMDCFHAVHLRCLHHLTRSSCADGTVVCPDCGEVSRISIYE